MLQRLSSLVAGLWLGGLATIAFIVAPALFTVLDVETAGRGNGAILAREAVASIVLAMLMLVLSRRQAAERLNLQAWLALGSLFCTIVGYYVVAPYFLQARQGLPTPGNLPAMRWHGISMAFFGLKIVLVAVMAWVALPKPGPRSLP